MTDLETRLRAALHDHTDRRSVDDLLDGVRRDVARRRRARTVVVVAAAVASVALVGGGVSWRHRTSSPVGHPAGVAHRTMAISVDASGTAFKVIGNQGCTRPCSTLWKAGDAGTWSRLATVHDASRGARPYGPILSLEMAPNGDDGWAWGSRLWSTHDGGVTWAAVTTLPGGTDPDRNDLDVSAGPSFTWARMARHGAFQLWRTPTGRDAWTRVRVPDHADQTIAAVLPDSRVAIPIRSGGDDYQRQRSHGSYRMVQHYYLGDGTGPWRRVTVRCLPQTAPFRGRAQKVSICGPGGHRVGAGELVGPPVTDGSPRFRDLFFPATSTGETRVNPLGHENQIHLGNDQAFLVTPQGAVPVALSIAPTPGLVDIAASGQHLVILTPNDQILRSADDGRHWSALG